ncbi:MAG: hypothetical protein KDA57_14645 [Planctomycetales bacterium]|nr:hypothetical protein [Planctomycetales bacterium]
MSFPPASLIPARVFGAWSVVLLALSLVGGQFAAQAAAQDSPEVSAAYGRGVHAYFGNQTGAAEQLFTQVVQAGSTDPRVYYFRAMTRLRMGRQYEAEDDMRVGAAYEARDPGKRHAIGMALQRIQGQDRRTLERFRREGRLNRVQQRREQSQMRYEQLQQRGPQVLRREAPVGLDQLADPAMELSAPTVPTTPSPVPPPEPAAAPQVIAPPAAEVPPPAPTIPSEVESPAPAPAVEEDDLFSDPAPATAEPSDVFGEPTSEPEMSEPTDDPFGESAPPVETEADPFGEAPAEEIVPAAEEEPPMAEEPAETDDLFGEPATEESSVDEAPEPSDPGDDLFGEPESSEAPAETAEEEDPFAEEMPAEESSSEEQPFDEIPAEEEPAEEAPAAEEPAETEDTDDLFGSATPDAPSEAARPVAGDKAESGKLLGVLGRVVGSTVPWRNMKLPSLPTPSAPSEESAEAGEIVLGPGPESFEEAVVPAAAEAPVESVEDEDLFGAEPSDSPVEEDPFADFGSDEPAEPATAEETEAPPAEDDAAQPEDDPFGEL